jgi:anti-anti-sigma regulatory factor
MTTAKAHTVELQGSLSVRDAAGLAATLTAALEAHPAVAVSTAAVTDADVSILQVLVAAHKSAARTGRGLTLKAPADGALRRTLVAAGFVSAAGEPLAPEGRFWTGSAGRSKGKPA